MFLPNPRKNAILILALMGFNPGLSPAPSGHTPCVAYVDAHGQLPDRYRRTPRSTELPRASCRNTRIRTPNSRALASIRGLKFSVDSWCESHSLSAAVLVTLSVSPSPNLAGRYISTTLVGGTVASPAKRTRLR